MRGQVGMISSSFSGTCLLLHHTVADEITHVVKTWASCVLKQFLKSKFGPENIFVGILMALQTPLVRGRLNDLVSFVLWFVQTFHFFCQKFPTKDVFTLNPWPTLSRQTLSRPTLIYITEPKKLHQQIWGVHIPSLKLPLWDLDLFPLLFLAVWFAPLLAKFLLSRAPAAVGPHEFHIGGFHWEKALTCFPASRQPANAIY